MGIIFKPNGSLDIATEPTDLPETVEKNMITSYAMQRCKNLRLDQVGVAKTRDGSSKINSAALAQTAIYKIIEQAGSRYCFAGTDIYKDEVSLNQSLTSAMWSGIKYNQFNSLIQSVYALNGTNRKRIEGSTVYEWGIAPPSAAPTLIAGDSATSSLLLHMNGTDASTTFTDSGSTGHAVTAVGNAQIDTAYKKFGTGSGLFDGTGDYLTIPDHTDFDLSGGIWTIDFWIKHGITGNGTLFYQDLIADPASYNKLVFVALGSPPSVRMRLDYYVDGTLLLSGGNLWPGSLYHVAIVENGANYYLFIDGVLINSTSSAIRSQNYDEVFCIGAIDSGAGGSGYYKGALDEFHIIKGIAAWTSNFTPPEKEYSSIPGLTGDYKMKYTYCRKSGTTVIIESNPSPANDPAIALYNQYFNASWTASGDGQVTHVRLYRTIANGAAFYHDQDIAIGTTSVVDTIADGALGSEIEENHDRPPLGTVVSGPHYNGNCFIIKDNLLYFCLAKRPEYWPTTYFLEMSPLEFTGQCLVFFNGQLYYITKHEIYLIQGTGPESFFPYPMQAITGAQGPQAAIGVAGHGIFHVGSDGVYLFSGTDRKLTQANFDPLFRGETINGMPGVSSLTNSWLIQFGNKIYFGYTSSGYTYPSNILCFNLDTARTSYYTYGREIRTVVVDEYNNRLLAADNSGYIWKLEDNSVTTDDGTEISWEVESKVFTLQTRRHFPRWCKYDVDASNSTTAMGQLILDNSVHQSHTLSEDRNIRKRLVVTGNGKRGSIRLIGTGPVSIFATETE